MTEARVGVRPLLLAWAGTAVAYSAKAVLTAQTTPLILDTDDAMRLTQVRDFLAGQNWFDLVQHRLNTPYGGLIHWSRLIDLPEAIVIGLLRLPFGAIGDVIAAYVWPLLLLLPLLWLSARLSLRLGGRAALLPGLLLPAFSLITLAEFAPGPARPSGQDSRPPRPSPSAMKPCRWSARSSLPSRSTGHSIRAPQSPCAISD